MAGMIPLSKAVIAEGVIAAEGLRRAVRPLEAGVLAEIYVQEGDQVRTGQLVARLEDQRAQAEYDATFQQLRQLAAREARMLSEQARIDEIDFDHWSLKNTDHPDVVRVLQSEINLLSARSVRRQTEKDALQAQIRQLLAQQHGVDQRVMALEAQKGLIDIEISDVSSLVDKGLAPKTRLLALQRGLADINGSLGELREQVTSLWEQVREREVALTSVDVVFFELLSEQLVEASTSRFALEKEVITLQDRLEKTFIRANSDGEVIGIQHSSAGTVIGAGELLFEIVPEQEDVLIEARVLPTDIDSVSLDMSTRVSFSSFNAVDLEDVAGHIQTISADVVTDEATGAGFYRIVVQASAEDLQRQAPNFRPVIGMPAEVYIVGGSQTILEYISKPIQNVIDRGLSEH